MREIKFRAWDFENKQMRTELRASEIGVLVEGGYKGLMQFTGLKDKNGKKIYEGDIVDGMATRYFIKNGGRGMYEFWESETEQGYHWGIWNVHNQLEIIGNIWENSELLTN